MPDDDRDPAQRLRAYESRLPDADAPDPRAIRPRGDRRLPVVAGVLSAAAVMEVVGGALLLNGQSSRVGEATTPPSPTASPSVSTRVGEPTPSQTATPSVSAPSPRPTVGELSGWRTAQFGAPGTVELASDLAPWAGGFVAVGTRYDAAQLPILGGLPPHEGRIWVSPDGSSWDEMTPTDHPFVGVELQHTFVVPGEDIVVVGSNLDASGRRPYVAWQSSDTRTWREIALTGIPADTHILDVEAGARGYLAAGITGADAGPSLWYSGDGLSWTMTREATGTDAPSAERFLGMDAGEEGFVVVTSREIANGESGVTAIASGDGRSWAVVDQAPPVSFARVAAIGADWMLLTADRISSQPDIATFQTWRSSDGLAWERSDDLVVPPFSLEEFGVSCSRVDPRLSSVGGVVIASFVAAYPCSEGGYQMPAGAWESTDGGPWVALPVEQRGFVASVGERAGLLVLAGHIGREEAVAAFWVGTTR